MPEISESRYLVQAGWDDVPHLSEQAKRELLDSTPPYMRAARSEGAPSLGAGAIFPIPWEEVSIPPIKIPDFWPRSYGLDVGWKMTAAVWSAWDTATGIQYVFSEYARGEAEPVIHASAIRTRGAWMKGAVDPAARGRGQRDGEVLLQNYRDLGLKLTPANNKVTGEGGGLDKIWQLLSAGRIKIFNTCVGLEAEYRVYHRDEKGRVVKQNDHRMDAFRYVTMSGEKIARTKPVDQPTHKGRMAADHMTGY